MNQSRWLTVTQAAAKLEVTPAGALKILKKAQAANPRLQIIVRSSDRGNWKVNPVELRKIEFCFDPSHQDLASRVDGLQKKFTGLARAHKALREEHRALAARLEPTGR